MDINTRINDNLILETGAQILMRVLHAQGIEVIFGYPGGAVLPIYDALYQQDKIKHILVRHEQAAVHAAEGYARSTGKTGVVLVTSGPGATNAVTGLLDALMDSVPLVCLTGQVPTHLIGNDAFQEADTTGITRPATKYNRLVMKSDELADSLHEAFYIAKSGRPGPVLVDLPKDIMIGLAPYREPKTSHVSYKPLRSLDLHAVEKAVDALLNAKRPIIYAGGGVINSGPRASELLTEMVREFNFPITNTLMGLGCYPASDNQFLGMLGMHGTYEANMAMHGCDVMFNIGARFDDRVTGRVDAFSPGSIKIHADIDASSINKIIHVDIPLVGDATTVLTAMLDAMREKRKLPEVSQWWKQISEWRLVDSLRCVQDMSHEAIIRPQHAIKRLSEITREMNLDTYITTEVGQHQMWAAQYFGFEKPNHWMTSGGLGTMGYGLPAGTGVQIAHPDALVIDIAGEASILMNIQELATLCQYRLPVKVFIINNQYMGMVRQWQELNHESRYSQSYSEALPDFVKLAEAFGGKGLRATNIGELDSVIKEMITHPGFVVADICVATHENCYPMIVSGAPHNEMLLPGGDITTEARTGGSSLV